MTIQKYLKKINKNLSKCLKKQTLWNLRGILSRNTRIEVMAKDENKKVLYSCKPAYDGILSCGGMNSMSANNSGQLHCHSEASAVPEGHPDAYGAPAVCLRLKLGVVHGVRVTPSLAFYDSAE